MKKEDKNWSEIAERLKLYTYEELEKFIQIAETVKKSKWAEHYKEIGNKYKSNKEKRIKNNKRLEKKVYPKILKFAKKMPIGTIYKVGGKYRKLVEIREDKLFGICGYFYSKQWHNTSYSAENKACLLQEAFINGKWITKKDILVL